MSSWANRGVLRKRDISKIPESLRPQIVPRVEKQEVILSESFIYKPQNDIIVQTTEKSSDSYPLRSLYPLKTILTGLSPGSFELTFNDKSYVFVILRHLRITKDNDLWITSYNSIRKFYTNKIIIIDDNSIINTVNGKLYNTEIIYSEFPGAGELLPYYYFLKYKWADNMIFLHDSMFINRPFKLNELDRDVKFHWYFESNGFDNNKQINSFLSLLSNGKELTEFISSDESSKKWKGCFGGTTIISYELTAYIEEKYNIFTYLAISIKTRKDRETFERILGIVLFYEEAVNILNCSNFGNIVVYPAAFESQNNNIDTASHIVGQHGYDTAILKVWRGR